MNEKSKLGTLTKWSVRIILSYTIGRLLYPLFKYLIFLILSNNFFLYLFDIQLDNQLLIDWAYLIYTYFRESWIKVKQYLIGSDKPSSWLNRDIEKINQWRSDLDSANQHKAAAQSIKTSLNKTDLTNSLRDKEYFKNMLDENTKIPESSWDDWKYKILLSVLGLAVGATFTYFLLRQKKFLQ